MTSIEVAEPIEASSLYSDAPLFSFGFGVQFNVGDFLRPVYAYDFPEMSSLERVDCIFQFFGEVKKCIQRFESIYCNNFSAVYVLFRI